MSIGEGPSDRVPGFGFAARTRVEISETDLGAVVYYGSYPRIVDRAILAFRRHLGVPLLGPPGHMFMVRRLELDYRSSARFDDLLEVHVRIGRLRRASHAIEARIDALSGEDARHVADATLEIVGVRAETMRLSPIPAELAEALERGTEGAA